MNALAAHRVKHHRQGCHKRFALARFHLGDFALIKHHTADELDIKVAHI